MRVKKKPAENSNWRIRDNQLYFFRPDPLKSSLDLDSNPWKLTVPEELRDQVLTENKNFEGPFFIKTKISPTMYEIKNKKGKSLGNWNVKDIKKYIEKTK